jgi:photosystem II stability/assembly factor-like uncharacterized protein
MVTIDRPPSPLESKGRTMGYLSRVAGIAFAALALLTSASAGVNTPQSGWYSGNPLLGPNTLRDVACVGSTCYASGDFGTLLKSTDAGATWTGIVTGLTLDLRRVRLAGGSADKVIVGGGCALRRSDDGGETFTRLPFTARDQGCAGGVISFSFPTDKAGLLLLEGGRVLATADGGRSFSRRTSVPNGAVDILCSSERTCLAVGMTPSFAGAVMRTNDAGVSWTQVGTAPQGLVSLEQADATTFYAVGNGSSLAKSVDGGQTWTGRTISGVPFRPLARIRCGDAQHCLVTTSEGARGGPLYRTSDGGSTFSAVTPSTDSTFAVEFADGLRSIAAGELGSAEISSDAGMTWAPVGNRVAGIFHTLATTADSVAYAGGAQGVLARTADGGRSWTNVSPPTEATVLSLAGFGPNRLYVLASDGSLQRSDNGGVSYSLLNPGAARPVAIATLDADRLLLLGSSISISRNGGDTFDRVSGPAASSQLGAADLAAGAVFAYGNRSVFVSIDRGGSWQRVKTPKRRAIADIDFVSEEVGYLLDTRGALWKTTKRGRSWRPMPGVGAPGSAVEFSSGRTGYVVVRGFGSLREAGIVMRTTDGGQSWHPQLVSRFFIASLENTGSIDYALANGSALYATGVGGDIGGPSVLTLSAKPRAPKRGRQVIVGGRLRPADGGEEIVVSRLLRGRWAHRLATAAANGSFLTRWRAEKGAVYVAQALGDADHRGAGTKPLLIKVR